MRHLAHTRNLEIPGSLVSLAPRNDGTYLTNNSPQPRPAAALALYNFVTLLEQPLTLAILALLLLLDVRAFFIGHDVLPAVFACTRTKTAFSFISKANSM